MSESELRIGNKTVEFTHTAVNKNAHLFINNDHDPELCPECIQPGTLSFEVFEQDSMPPEDKLSKSYKLALKYIKEGDDEAFVDLIQNNLTLDESVALIKQCSQDYANTKANEARIDEWKRAKILGYIPATHLYKVERRISALESERSK